MREILFRAYHIPTKRLIPVYGFNKENVFEETFDGIDIGTNVLPLSQCILQQFTGLTDKNGTKVFEGDILEVVYYNYTFKNTKLIQEVYYLEESSCFCVKTVRKTVDTIEYDRNNVPLSWTNKPNSIEVIGNIHDNPELLK